MSADLSGRLPYEEARSLMRWWWWWWWWWSLFRTVHARGAIPNEVGPTLEEEEEFINRGNGHGRGKHNSVSCGSGGGAEEESNLLILKR